MISLATPNFGFNFTCEMAGTNKKRAVIKGQITYHDDPSTIDVPVNPKLTRSVDTSFIEVMVQGSDAPVILGKCRRL